MHSFKCYATEWTGEKIHPCSWRAFVRLLFSVLIVLSTKKRRTGLLLCVVRFSLAIRTLKCHPNDFTVTAEYRRCTAHSTSHGTRSPGLCYCISLNSFSVSDWMLKNHPSVITLFTFDAEQTFTTQLNSFVCALFQLPRFNGIRMPSHETNGQKIMSCNWLTATS